MKKLSSSLALAALACAVFFCTSCGSKGDAQQEAEALSFDSLVVDTATQVVNGTDTLKATVHIKLMLAVGTGADAVNDSILNSGIMPADFMPKEAEGMTVEQRVKAFAKNFLDSYRNDCENMMKSGSVSPAFQYTYDLNTEINENAADSIINYEMTGSVFMGGAHGATVTMVRNFKKATGEFVGKGELLSADGEKAVAEMICGELQKQFKSKDMAELKSNGIFQDKDAYVPANFIIAPDSVTFIYMSDEVAPHAVGELRATLSKEALAKYLKK